MRYGGSINDTTEGWKYLVKEENIPLNSIAETILAIETIDRVQSGFLPAGSRIEFLAELADHTQNLRKLGINGLESKLGNCRKKIKRIVRIILRLLHLEESRKVLSKQEINILGYIESLFSELRGALSEVRVARDLLTAGFDVEFNPKRKGPDLFLSCHGRKIPIEISNRIGKKNILAKQSLIEGRIITPQQIIREIILSSHKKIQQELNQAPIVILDISQTEYGWVLPFFYESMPNLADTLEYLCSKDIIDKKNIVILYCRIDGKNYSVPLIY